ncbi:MAG: molybdenum cofactor guanylyltransferase [Acidobacteriota bacterium]
MSAAEAPVGVVLAGGDSRRLGQDKARLPLPGSAGEDLLAWAVRRVAEVCGSVAVADRGRHSVGGARSVDDGPGRGPAAGILGAACAFPGRPLLVLACDLPLVPVAALSHIASAPAGPCWVVPERNGRLEPLCALYRPPALLALAARVGRRRWDLQGLRADLGTEAIEVLRADLWEPAEGEVSVFLNVNRPQDVDILAAARRNCLRDGSNSR